MKTSDACLRPAVRNLGHMVGESFHAEIKRLFAAQHGGWAKSIALRYDWDGTAMEPAPGRIGQLPFLTDNVAADAAACHINHRARTALGNPPQSGGAPGHRRSCLVAG